MSVVSIGQYETLISDRPKKFSAEQVGFEAAASDQRFRCDGCLHWYQGQVAKRSVCEIYAPAGERRHVPPESSCLFWNRNGRDFPRLEKEEPAPAARASSSHTIG